MVGASTLKPEEVANSSAQAKTSPKPAVNADLNGGRNLSSFDDDLFNGLRGADGVISPSSIRAACKRAGILDRDPRLQTVFSALAKLEPDAELSYEQLTEALSDNLRLAHRVAAKELAIANFQEFAGQLENIFAQVEPDRSGANAGYIPILRDADSEKFGVAFCSVDGQFHEFGDTRDTFTVQSTSKPVTFAMALEQLGTTEVLKWCGIEPSGRAFNDMTLLPDNRPYNPMVNSGALMTAGLLASAHPSLAEKDAPTGAGGYYGAELYEKVVRPHWQRLAGDGIVGDVGFSDETFVSERETADNNIAIAYLLKSRKGLRGDVQLDTMVDLYLRACSTTASAASMAVVAATLANGGKNPFSGDQLVQAENVKRTLSVMSFCGFYDNAGEFFFETGIPSKSGVSGVVFLVLPNVGGFAIFSPRLDGFGNSVRGGLFAKKLVDLFTFHSFDSLTSFATGCKFDPRFSCDFSQHRHMARMQWGIRAGDRKSREFHALLLHVCVCVAAADGDIDESERDVLRKTILSIMQSPVREDDLKEKEAEIMGIPIESRLEGLAALARSKEKAMDDIEKELMMEATFKVSTADGEIAENERRTLSTLATALKISPGVLDLKISTFSKGFTSP